MTASLGGDPGHFTQPPRPRAGWAEADPAEWWENVGTATGRCLADAGAIDRLFRCWQEVDAGEQQQRLDAVRSVVERAALLPSVKAVLARYRNDPVWETVRPPLVELDAAQVQALDQGLDALGFAMPGLNFN